MKSRYRLFFRSGVFYSFDRETGKRESLETSDKSVAQRLLCAKNEGTAQASLNLHLARTYLSASDPQVVQRTWGDVLAAIIETKSGETRTRWLRAGKDPALSRLWRLRVFETRADDFLRDCPQ